MVSQPAMVAVPFAPHSSAPAGSSQPGAGWRAELSLRLAPRVGKTRIAELSHEGPLRIQRELHPEGEGTAHVYLLHPPGGVVGGDALRVTVTADADASAVILTPGATKLYRTDGAVGVVDTELHVGPRARLEYLPYETIAFDGTDARQTTRVHANDSSSFVVWDIVCLGRPACDEAFERGRLRLRLEVFRNGLPILLDWSTVRGETVQNAAAWSMRGHAALGTMVFSLDSSARVALADELAERSHDDYEYSATAYRGLAILRALGRDGVAVRRTFSMLWRKLRACDDRPDSVPAIWNS